MSLYYLTARRLRLTPNFKTAIATTIKGIAVRITKSLKSSFSPRELAGGGYYFSIFVGLAGVILAALGFDPAFMFLAPCALVLGFMSDHLGRCSQCKKSPMERDTHGMSWFDILVLKREHLVWPEQTYSTCGNDLREIANE
jgi:hypothetical protein